MILMIYSCTLYILYWYMGSDAYRNKEHCPPFSFWKPTMILAPPPNFEKFIISNLVNNEVFKKLTTKLASTKYYGNLV